MGFLGNLFDDDGPMGGVVNLPPSKKPGKWRPGLRSTEIALEKKYGAGKAGAAPTKAPVKTLPGPLPTRTAGGTYIARTPPPASSQRPVGTAKANLPPPAATGARPTPESPYLDAQTFSRLLFASAAQIAALPLTDPVFAKRLSDQQKSTLQKGWPAQYTAYNRRQMQRTNTMMGDGDLLFGDDPVATIDPSDPGAQPGYYGNGQAWISQQEVQLYWTDNLTRWTRPFNDPILYPDGTPLKGHIWLPRANLGALYKPYVWAFPISNGGDRFDFNGDGTVSHYFDHVPPGFPVDQVSGDAVRSWKPGAHTIDGALARKVEAGQSAAPWGNIEPWGVRIETGKKGSTLYGYIGTNFDFAAGDPTSRAYCWLWQYVTPTLLSWDARPADLWLSDGTPIGSSGNFYLAAPPPPFLCVEFLDALMTGAHGLPQVVDPTYQTIDFRAFSMWAAADPQWRQIIPALQRQPFVCATVYDVVQVPTTGQIQQVPPAASTPPATDSPQGIPLPDGTYYDPVTGQIYDPYGVTQQGQLIALPDGRYFDPVSGQYVDQYGYPQGSASPYGPSTGIVPPSFYDPYGYGLSPGDTTDIPGFDPYSGSYNPGAGQQYSQPAYPTEYQLPEADEDGDFTMQDQYSSGYPMPGRDSFPASVGPSAEDFYAADYGEAYTPAAPQWGDDVDFSAWPPGSFVSTADDW